MIPSPTKSIVFADIALRLIAYFGIYSRVAVNGGGLRILLSPPEASRSGAVSPLVALTRMLIYESSKTAFVC